eukprot:UN03182
MNEHLKSTTLNYFRLQFPPKNFCLPVNFVSKSQ